MAKSPSRKPASSKTPDSLDISDLLGNGKKPAKLPDYAKAAKSLESLLKKSPKANADKLLKILDQKPGQQIQEVVAESIITDSSANALGTITRIVNIKKEILPTDTSLNDLAAALNKPGVSKKLRSKIQEFVGTKKKTPKQPKPAKSAKPTQKAKTAKPAKKAAKPAKAVPTIKKTKPTKKAAKK